MTATGNRLNLSFVAAIAFAALSSSLVFAEEYPMSEIPIGDPRWQNILEQVNGAIAGKAKAAEEAGEKKTVEILQNIEGNSYLAQMRTPQQVAGSAARAMGTLFNDPSRSIVPPGEWETIRIDLPEGTKPLADGEKFPELLGI